MVERITMAPGKRSGQPCVRGPRITVWDVLSRLAAGMSEKAQVQTFDLLARSDRDIAESARREGFMIVTADADFHELAATFGPPPKWCGSGDGRTQRASLSS